MCSYGINSRMLRCSWKTVAQSDSIGCIGWWRRGRRSWSRYTLGDAFLAVHPESIYSCSQMPLLLHAMHLHIWKHWWALAMVVDFIKITEQCFEEDSVTKRKPCHFYQVTLPLDFALLQVHVRKVSRNHNIGTRRLISAASSLAQ